MKLTKFKTIIISIIAVLLIALSITTTLFIRKALLDIRRSKLVFNSSLILEEMNPIFEINSMEYVYKTVFPYDLLPAEEDMNLLLEKDASELTKTELFQYNIYDFCVNNKFKPYRDGKFFVFTTFMRSGYKIDGDNKIIEVVSMDEKKCAIVLKLADPQVLDLSIEDVDSDKYSYPDLVVSPEILRVITDYMNIYIKEKSTSEDMVDSSKENFKNRIENLLKENNWASVKFSE